MSIGMETSLSALRALGDRQAVSANNLANSSSSNYKATTAIITEDKHGTPRLLTGNDQTQEQLPATADGATSQGSTVDIVRELTDMTTTRHFYSANLKALQTADEMTGTLLDLKA